MSKVAEKDTSQKRFSTAVENLKIVLGRLFGSDDQRETDELETYLDSADSKTAQALIESSQRIDKQVAARQKKADSELNKLKYKVPGIEGANVNDSKETSHSKEHEERE